MAKDKLVTPSYCFLLAANFLLFFAFYLILPILPFYLSEVFQAENSLVGIVLSVYTVAALCIRPFSGFLLDILPRKPLYLLAYFIFTSVFAGYMWAGVLSLFIAFRVIHGLSFGMVTVGGNTIVIDVTPSSRRGEAIGYYGLMNNMAMSIGPMVGLFMHDAYSFETIFTCSLISGSIGFLMACLVKTPKKEPVESEPISLDRFFLIKGIPAGISLLLLSIPYGMTTTYVAIYAQHIGISVNTGLFFTFLAVGMAVSRLFAGKQVDKGRITEIISAGFYVVCTCFFLLAACGTLIKYNAMFTNILFFAIPLMLGVGFGTMFPAFNSLFVNLAPNSKRGTATSTYLTSWDVGIGIGLMSGGFIAQYISFDVMYFSGACLTVLSAIYFRVRVTPLFHKNKLR
ncbi:MFS transporter [Bacteroides sp. 214]|uniref:MFS transporter n=1 Tax=Bacteroides sp. 214 TaxID=2302935 RepID=UPI0013CFF95A|nr:MFS transporter [Bacteroides sp. 214]NDW12392.1 MFS transporter [Bacteroides sp. 214]